MTTVPTPAPGSSLDVALRYVAAIAAGATGEALAAFYTPDVVITELPNRFTPNGARRTLAESLAAAERGAKFMRDQRYEIVSALADGDRVALEFDWRGTVAVDVGPLAAGTVMRAHVATVLELRDGKIAAQRHYDCYEPF